MLQRQLSYCDSSVLKMLEGMSCPHQKIEPYSQIIALSITSVLDTDCCICSPKRHWCYWNYLEAVIYLLRCAGSLHGATDMKKKKNQFVCSLFGWFCIVYVPAPLKCILLREYGNLLSINFKFFAVPNVFCACFSFSRAGRCVGLHMAADLSVCFFKWRASFMFSYCHSKLFEPFCMDFFSRVLSLQISVVIFVQPKFGYYIHGRSAQGHADVSMREMHELLRREEVRAGVIPSSPL